MNPSSSKTIVFIHGLFVNNLSWNSWIKFYEAKGYTCHAPAYPFHEGEPSDLRQSPPSGLGKLGFKTVVKHFSDFIDTLPEKPILIGHSVGGLIVQKLIEQDKGYAGIAIHPAPPTFIFSFKWSFFKANLPVLNFFKGNSVFTPSVEWFNYAFCNNMTMEETAVEHAKFVVPESRNIPRQAVLGGCIIDFKKPHKPLLILAGDKDNIIPASLNQSNFNAYKDKGSRTDFKIFPDRTHYVCGQANWEEVASYIQDWIHSLK